MGFHQWVEIGLLALLIVELAVIIRLLDRPRHEEELRRYGQPLKKGMGTRPSGRPPLGDKRNAS